MRYRKKARHAHTDENPHICSVSDIRYIPFEIYLKNHFLKSIFLLRFFIESFPFKQGPPRNFATGPTQG